MTYGNRGPNCAAVCSQSASVMTVDSGHASGLSLSLAHLPGPPLTVIDIIHAQIRVLWVVDDERATETVTVLRHVVAVVPERARLADGREVVQERVERLDGTLRDERGAVRPRRSVLEDSVPVLPVVRVR